MAGSKLAIKTPAYIQSFIKIGSVPAEKLLIWTNVTRTNVAWTNVNLVVVICFRCSQKPMFKSFIKIGSVTAEILETLSLCGVGGAKSFSGQTQPCVEVRLGF